MKIAICVPLKCQGVKLEENHVCDVIQMCSSSCDFEGNRRRTNVYASCFEKGFIFSPD